jgi:hypothetical protein
VFCALLARHLDLDLRFAGEGCSVGQRLEQQLNRETS